MAPAQSTLRQQSPEEFHSLNAMLWPPAIPFIKDSSQNQKEDNKSNEDSSENKGTNHTRALKVKINSKKDSTEDDNLITVHLPIYENGTPEDFCYWRTQVDEFLVQKGVENDPDEANSLYLGLLKGKAREQYSEA